MRPLVTLCLACSLSACSFIKQRELAIGAKAACSATYVANRPLGEVYSQDLQPIDKVIPLGLIHPLRDARVEPTADGQGVQASLGDLQVTAKFRGDLGCALDHGPASMDAPVAQCIPQAPALRSDLPWPEGEPEGSAVLAGTPDTGVVQAAHQHVQDHTHNGARAVVVVKGGRIVAEAYADGFGAHSKLLGWSMAKSVTGMLLGAALKTSDVDRDIAQWLPPSNLAPRMGKITVRDLLEMRSGMAWNENYGSPAADVNNMLFDVSDMADYAMRQPSVAEPGKVFQYNSGSSNVLQAILRKELEQRTGGYRGYCSFPYTALFHPIGALSARFETDGHGTFVGSSYLHASARDWARLGLLLLKEGRWPVTGQQVLPRDWVQQSKPGARHSGFAYGWQLWGLVDETWSMRMGSEEGIPADAFHMAGHWGQSVTVIPSRDMVIVRLGWSTQSGSYRGGDFLRSVLAANQ